MDALTTLMQPTQKAARLISVVRVQIPMKKIYLITVVCLIISTIVLALYVFRLKSNLKDSQSNFALLQKEIHNLKQGQANEFYETYKRDVQDQIEENINSIIEREPEQGGMWFVTKMEFMDPLLVSIEYEDGHNIYVAKLKITKTFQDYGFTVIK